VSGARPLDVFRLYDANCNRLDERYAARTRATRYTSLRGFLFYCGLEPTRLITPSVHKKLKSYEKKKVGIYRREEVRNILGVCDPYHHALFMFWLLLGRVLRA